MTHLPADAHRRLEGSDALLAEPSEAPSYSARIMNLRCAPPLASALQMSEAEARQRRRGHRDARHAAAEIALEAEAVIACLRAELATLSAPARLVEAVALTPDQRKAIKQFMKMGEDSLNLAHSGYFSEGGWAYEQLAGLAAPKE